MAYPSVDKGHIVPRVYLRNFANGSQIELHLVGTESSHVVNIAKAGTRQRPYRRTRPSGEQIDDAEWSLAHIERAAAPLLHEVEERWPLTFEDKRTLAEFFAVQMVRGPRFFDYRAELVEQSLRAQADQLREETALPEQVIQHQVELAGEKFLSDTGRLVSMLGLSRLVTTHLASMHWTLLRFDRPVIAVSDQPVVIWPLTRGRSDASIDPAWGPGEALEVRVPVSSNLAMVMAWVDEGTVPCELAGTATRKRLTPSPSHRRIASGCTFQDTRPCSATASSTLYHRDSTAATRCDRHRCRSAA